jgi:hypothetical protein
MRFSILATALSLLLVAAGVAGQQLAELLADTEVVKGFDWEWVLIRIDGVQGNLGNADYGTAADTQVVVTALGAVHPDIDFDTTLSKYESFIDEGNDSPEW